MLESQPPAQLNLDGLKSDERAACLVVVNSIGAVAAEAWDVGGRQGAVDAMLTLQDGRKAALEVTRVAGDGALETASLLARDNHRWPLPGRWFWSIEVGQPNDLRRLKKCYEKIILICEGQDVVHPDRDIGWRQDADPDLRWLVRESSCNMIGHPELLAQEMKRPGAHVVPVAGGGVIDSSMPGFGDALRKAFDLPHVPPHFVKLARADADERHLFVPLHDSALPFSISSELMFGDMLPPDPPPIPEYITHLWLAPAFSSRVLLWCKALGWRNFHPYDRASDYD